MIKIKLTRDPNFRRLNPGAISEVAFKQLKALWRAAIRAFIDAAIVEVHLDTGMSRASLLPLAGAVRHRAEIQPLTVGRRTRKGVTMIDGGYQPGATKGPSTGAKFGREAYTISFGTKNQVALNFSFNIVIYQWGYWENMWKALQAGRLAFIDFIEKQADNFLTARPFKTYFETGRLPVVAEG